MTNAILETPLPRAATLSRVSPVLELRQYTLRPGRRETLIDLFEREFVESQEAVGMELVGQFRDLDAPDRFVWLRGFPDHDARAKSLAAFYGGSTWKAHREAANATMIDSDNVLMLRPGRPVDSLPPRDRVARDGLGVADPRVADRGVVHATLHYLNSSDPSAFLACFERRWTPMLWNANVAVVASLVTDPRPNNFPALPVREGESVFVWFSRHANLSQATQAQARMEKALEWSPAIADELAAHEARPRDCCD